MTKSPRPLNAWKHGGYSNLGVLPGEDPKEFDDFHPSLIEEWQPSGATECDAVLSLAKCMWRKSRMNIYRQAAAARKTFAGAESDPLQFYWDACEEATKGYEPPEWLMQKIEVTIAELEGGKEKEKLREQQLAIIEHITPDGLQQELALDALLDAKIDRLSKRLLHLKAAKQMIRGAMDLPVAARPTPRLITSCAP